MMGIDEYTSEGEIYKTFFMRSTHANVGRIAIVKEFIYLGEKNY